MKDVSFRSTVFANLAIVVFGPLRLRNLIVSCFGFKKVHVVQSISKKDRFCHILLDSHRI